MLNLRTFGWKIDFSDALFDQVFPLYKFGVYKKYFSEFALEISFFVTFCDKIRVSRHLPIVNGGGNQSFQANHRLALSHWQLSYMFSRWIRTLAAAGDAE